MANESENILTLDQSNFFPIESFCDDILLNIFKHLNLKDRKAVSLVCWHWCGLISSHTLAVDYQFVLRGHLFLNHPPLSILLNSIRIFPHIKIVLKSTQEVLTDLLLFLARYGKLIKRLHLKGFEKNEIVQPILDRCSNLMVLKVNDIDDLDVVQQVPPSLHTLIVIKKVQRQWEQREPFKQINKIILKKLWFLERRPLLLNQVVPKTIYNMQSPDLDLFTKTYKELTFALAVANINMNDSDLIGFTDVHSVILVIYGPIPYSSFLCKRFPNLKELYVNARDQACFDFHQKIDLSSVQKLCIYSDPRICNHCLGYFLQSCSTLKELCLSTRTIGSVEFEIISSNSQQLQKLAIEYIFLGEIKSSPGLFEGLNDLEELIFQPCIGKTFGDLAKFSQFGHLPKLWKLTLNQEDVIMVADMKKLRYLALKWPNVTSLNLRVDDLSFKITKLILKTWPKLTYLKLQFMESNELRYCFGELFASCLTKFSQHLVKCKCNLIKIKDDDDNQLLGCFRPAWVNDMFENIATLEEFVVRDYRYTRFASQRIPGTSGLVDTSDEEDEIDEEAEDDLSEDPDHF